MKKNLLYLALLCFSCKTKTDKPDPAVSYLDLKRGQIVSCGPQDGEIFGSVSFSASVPKRLKSDFNTAIALLHSFEYDEAEKMFAKVIDQAPDCAMAYWGVAMSNFHPLWAPPTLPELQKGEKAIALARSIASKTKRESDYIEAMGKFYENADQLGHGNRVLNFEKAMEKLYLSYPGDRDAAIFYALALAAGADPADKTYSHQRKAFAILNPIFQEQPLHPGVAHYIIHNCDYPDIADLALPAAKKYASIAPASAHAQHMPSHIFTRLGLWDDCIQSNLQAAASAKCYAEQAKIAGHWDEELHAIDYRVYAYLQKGDDEPARAQVDYLRSFTEVSPVNFKVAYAFAAVPARYVLERKKWSDAATLEIHPPNFPWEKFPWQEAITHFARLLGMVHTGDLDNARSELQKLKSLNAKLEDAKDKAQEAAQVAIQIKASEAWIELRSGNNNKALEFMAAAADMEDRMEKHPVTPGEIIPARELLAEMLLEMNKPGLALESFEQVLKTHVNRFNAVYGAAIAAQSLGNKEKAAGYFQKLLQIANPKSRRIELQKARSFGDLNE
jgi:tetratricopeptide (TPR) repeat protein